MRLSRRRKWSRFRNRIKQRQRALLARAGVLLALMAVLLGMLSWVSHYPRYQITEIAVRGSEALDDRALAEVVRDTLSGRYAALFARSNAFIYPRSGISDRLRKTYPRIRTLDVDTVSLHAIRIEITERTPAGLWCGTLPPEERNDLAEACYFMDNEGFIFSDAPVFSSDVYFTAYGPLAAARDPIYRDASKPTGKRFAAPEVFAHIIKVRDLLRRSGLAFQGAAVETGSDYKLFLDTGGFIKASTSIPPEETARDAAAAIEVKQRERERFFEELEYIDARFADFDRIFFKFAD